MIDKSFLLFEFTLFVLVLLAFFFFILFLLFLFYYFCLTGYETARTLAYHGCTVVFACRSINKAENAISKIQAQRPNASCHALHIDLASLESVRTFAQTFAIKFE